MRPHLSRRTFLHGVSTTSAAVGLGLGAGCATPPPANPSPARIIDTHTHFYDPARPQGVPWPPKTDALLHRPVLPRHYQALAVPQAVNGTVVVEASPLVEDNQWILNLARDNPFIVGFVGNLPVGTPEFRAHLRRFSINRLFRGIRVRGISLCDGLGNPAFVDDLRALADAGLALDVPSQADAVAEVDRLARAVPGLRIVVNHVAGVAVDGQSPPDKWVAQMQTIAQHRGVFMKVSGLVEGTRRTNGAAPAGIAHYRPVLDVLWKSFGVERLLYGSNWPVSERFAPLGTVEKIALDYFAAKGRAALDRVFWKNSLTAYRWVHR